jgi:hypothetical protein
MLTKSKIALATALVALTGSVALAQDFNTKFAYPKAQSGPAQLRTRGVSLPTGQSGAQGWFEIERSDRASSPYAGGG